MVKRASAAPPPVSEDAAAQSGRHTSPARVVRRPAAVAALLIGLLLAGAGVAGFAVAASHPGHPAAAARTGRPPRVPAPTGKLVPIPKDKWGAVPQALTRRVARPVSLIIPAIGVRTRLVHLGLMSNGTLQVPSSAAVAGWYTGSPRPGQPGGAVIAGHIDSHSQRGVFYWLRDLRPGEKIFIRRADHTLAMFKVTSVRSYLKREFPTQVVYGPTPDAQLRLITCGGTFDWSTGHYLSNTIAYATLVP